MPGLVLNPASALLGDGTQAANNVFGKQGEQLNADLHGKWFNGNSRKSLFAARATGLTVPVIAASLVSVFTLYNPPGSGVMAEIVRTEIGQVLAATVVDDVNWYSSSAVLTAAGTFTTPGVAGTNYFSGRVGDTPNGQVKFFSAYTHSGTPVWADYVATYGATTDSATQLVKWHEGTLLLPPGIAMSLAMSTTISTASGLSMAATWVEWPFA